MGYMQELFLFIFPLPYHTVLLVYHVLKILLAVVQPAVAHPNPHGRETARLRALRPVLLRRCGIQAGHCALTIDLLALNAYKKSRANISFYILL